MSDNWKSCDNCEDQRCYRLMQQDGLPTDTPCDDWKPIRCRCGGALSETRIYHYSGGPIAKSRKYDGKPYRHCFSCHSEFFINEGEEK